MPDEGLREDATSEPGLSAPAASRRSGPWLPAAPSSRGSSPLGLDGESSFGDFGGLGDLPEFEALFQPTISQSHDTPSLSTEIEALLANAALRARAHLSSPRTEAPPVVTVSAEVVSELEELLATQERAVRAEAVPTGAMTGLDGNQEQTGRPPDRLDVAGSKGPASRSTVTPTEGDPTAPSPASFAVPLESTVADALASLFPTSGRPDGVSNLDEGPMAASLRSLAEARPTIFELRPGSAEEPTSTTAALEVAEERSVLTSLARAIRNRATCALSIATPTHAGSRVVLLRDGDVVTVDSTRDGETLVQMLAERGDIARNLADERDHRLPRSGRLAAAALIAQGFLAQDELWNVLRAHAEWVLVRAMSDPAAIAEILPEVPERLASEPNVFGGATGVEVFVEVTRRAFDEASSRRIVEGLDGKIVRGGADSLVHEAALDTPDLAFLDDAIGRSVTDVVAAQPDFTAILVALLALDALRVERAAPLLETVTPSSSARRGAEVITPDDEEIRAKVAARLALVREGNYFALLDLHNDASSHELRQSFLALRRTFEPARLLGATTRDLEDDVRLIVDVLEEAYDVLSDEQRRSRYRKALAARPE